VAGGRSRTLRGGLITAWVIEIEEQQEREQRLGEAPPTAKQQSEKRREAEGKLETNTGEAPPHNTQRGRSSTRHEAGGLTSWAEKSRTQPCGRRATKLGQGVKQAKLGYKPQCLFFLYNMYNLI